MSLFFHFKSPCPVSASVSKSMFMSVLLSVYIYIKRSSGAKDMEQNALNHVTFCFCTRQMLAEKPMNLSLLSHIQTNLQGKPPLFS